MTISWHLIMRNSRVEVASVRMLTFQCQACSAASSESYVIAGQAEQSRALVWLAFVHRYGIWKGFLLRGKDIRVNFGLNFRVPFLGPSKEKKEKGGQKWRLLKDPPFGPTFGPNFRIHFVPFVVRSTLPGSMASFRGWDAVHLPKGTMDGCDGLCQHDEKTSCANPQGPKDPQFGLKWKTPLLSFTHSTGCFMIQMMQRQTDSSSVPVVWVGSTYKKQTARVGAGRKLPIPREDRSKARWQGPRARMSIVRETGSCGKRICVEISHAGTSNRDIKLGPARSAKDGHYS